MYDNGPVRTVAPTRPQGTGSLARRCVVTTGAVAFIVSARLRSHPHGAFRALRAVDPVHHSPLGFWLLAGHEEVGAALRNPALGNDESRADLGLLHLGPFMSEQDRRPGPFRELAPSLLLFMDPPDHTRIRSLVSKAFTPKAVGAIEARIGELVHRRLDTLESAGSMDLLSDLAYPVPALVICELLGAPATDAPFLARHAPALAARLDPNPFRNDAIVASSDEATVAMTDYLGRLIDERHRHPGDDLLSALITAQEDGDRLSHDELVANVILLLLAGHETTANLLGNGLYALLRHPDQLALLRRNPELDRTAVDELLRFDGPVQLTERVALAPVRVGTALIPEGSIVVLCISAANRDPLVFSDPDRLDVARSPNPHLSFGGGAHFCIGAPLARLEARIALRAVLDRLPDLALAQRRQHWRKTLTVRGLQRLDLTWGPAAA
jgi:pimeloyl-[acyl-carrier protein] synthase